MMDLKKDDGHSESDSGHDSSGMSTVESSPIDELRSKENGRIVTDHVSDHMADHVTDHVTDHEIGNLCEERGKQYISSGLRQTRKFFLTLGHGNARFEVFTHNQ